MTNLPTTSTDSLATVAFNVVNRQNMVDLESFMSALEDHFKLAFALAFSKYLDPDAEATQIDGSSQAVFVGLFTTEAIAITAELILAIAAALSLALAVIYSHRPSIVKSDPDSLATMCNLIANSFARHHYLAHASMGFDHRPTSVLLEAGDNQPPSWIEDGDGQKLMSGAPNCKIIYNPWLVPSTNSTKYSRTWIQAIRHPTRYRFLFQNEVSAQL